MLPISFRFKQYLATSHEIAVRVDVTDHFGNILASTTPSAPYVLKVLSGSVSVQSGRGVRRQGSMVVANPDGSLTPLYSSDLFSPVSSHEIRPYRGIRFPDGTEELVPLGVFGIVDVEATDVKAERQLTVSFVDRADRISRARFEDVYVISVNTNYVTALEDLIRSRWAGVTFLSQTTGHSTPLLIYDMSRDPWEVAQEMAGNFGFEVFFEPSQGWCVLRRVISASGVSSAWHYREGTSGDAVILSINRQSSNRRAFNGAIVTGGTSEDGAPPVRATIWNEDVSSPLYYLGPYGKVPETHSSTEIRTAAQAYDTALAMIVRQGGATETVGFSAIVNPAHDAEDIVLLTRGASRLSSTMQMVEEFTVPFFGSRMEIQCRERILETLSIATSTGGGGGPAPDTTPPTVSITAPSSGATLSGTVTISATATDP